MTVRIITGDSREVLRTLPDESVHCVVTSPPYWGLRDYGNGNAGIGLEPTVSAHIAALVDVFAEVRRVLRKDGTLWLNYGDAYAQSGNLGRKDTTDEYLERRAAQYGTGRGNGQGPDKGAAFNKLTAGLKPKDLIGLPWRLAFALQEQGWWLRSDIIWAKPNPMPESVTDRPTRAHEYVFMLSKAARYWYDADAIAEEAAYPPGTHPERAKGYFNGKNANGSPAREESFRAIMEKRNARTVWNIATEPFPEAHFATFPTALAERCIKAGCPIGGTVLDPFGGAGTVGLVADRLQRNAILIELNPQYAAMAERRIRGDAPIFAEVASD